MQNPIAVIFTTSRAAARVLKAELIAQGFEDAKVVDNGADAANRWSVVHAIKNQVIMTAENFEKVEQAIAAPAAPTPALVELMKRETPTRDEVRQGCAMVRAQMALKEAASKVKRPTKKWEYVNPDHGKQTRRNEKKAPMMAKKNRQPVKENALSIALQVAFKK